MGGFRIIFTSPPTSVNPCRYASRGTVKNDIFSSHNILLRVEHRIDEYFPHVDMSKTSAVLVLANSSFSYIGGNLLHGNCTLSPAN